jgi:hypothetical protein
VLARALEPKDIQGLLGARGLLPEEARRGAELVGSGRARLGELAGPPTLETVAEAVSRHQADPLRLYRDARLIPLRSEPRWAELVRQADR